MWGLTVKEDVPKNLIDEYRAQIKCGIIILIVSSNDKFALLAGVSDNLCDRISAVDVVRRLSPLIGGQGGGGRAQLAQTGGNRACDVNALALQLKEICDEYRQKDFKDG